MSVGKSVRLFLADGTPGGLLTAEIMNWTGHVVAAPRSDLASLLKRPETSRTGIYVLIGDDPDSLGGALAYIGEGDDVSRRLYQHARSEEQGGKDFWVRAIVLTSKDTNLTKAHARYLESRFITIAREANRAKLTNSTAPIPILLPEADVSDMEYFIAQAQIVFPVLGVNIFRSVAHARDTMSVRPGGSPAWHESPLFDLGLKKDGLMATAREIDGEFTVLEGSRTRLAWTGSPADGYGRLKEKLDRDGTTVLSPDGQTKFFVHDQVFASPSAAAAVVFGRTTNGRTEWKVRGTGVSYGAWQSEGVDLAVPAPAGT
ncbi:GIY-YIG nuclease family protein [Cryobacterium sp. 10S3]|uniref:GIY-YIG nuclease family protein n=1 Tax=unclassified Cryobacterium TaxID=2649013 RepID=UPI002AC9BDF9|nr:MULTISPECIES: GIY-YIG nuclease family protein [unclassified Cryobacterium]MEB0001677.1 GIY-YIG nuclease family protein [Cryobacterium sp. RTC2.1]MEB0286708.1 GIY-YIG nuclease family protein [Cryobacterium sp. 10S3]WPX13171.1 GIY-YIG nuclease family protein [Cryobacterium sp. 10S3]